MGETPDEQIERLELAALVSDDRIRALVEEVENLHAAMEHRSVIEQAKGVLMHTLRIGPEAAFALLVAQSQHENRKLREIAVEIAGRQEPSGSDVSRG